jgi:Amt family ammonium transporter
LRVSPEEELEGLDFSEHGGNAYPDFEVSSHGGMGSVPGFGSPISKKQYEEVGELVQST